MKRGRRARLLGSTALLGCAWLSANSARADLDSDAALLAARGQKPNRAYRLPARLGERSVPLVLFLPQEVLSGPASSCLSVAILGPNTAHFTVRAAGPSSMPDWPDPGAVSSLAGLAELVYCGARKTRLAVLVVEMRSPRAVLETVVVEAATPVPPATDSLPHRDPGPLEPPLSFERVTHASLAQRLSAREQRAVREGWQWEPPRQLPRLAPFGGSYTERVEPGCHEFGFVLDAIPAARGERIPEGARDGGAEAIQLSVEPDLGPHQALFARQRGDGSVSHLGLCAGEEGRVTFSVSFVPRQAELWLTHARTSLPAHVPEQLGAAGKAAMAALLTRHALRVPSAPVDVALGITGPTWLPASVEPGACYLAALVRIGGATQSLALAAQVGRTWTRNRSRDDLGTLVAFCAGEHAQARLEADARGAGVTWLYALWQTGRQPLGAPLP